MFEPRYPYHREEILAAMKFTRDDIARFYASIGVDEFYARPSQGWSPARNLKHLTKSAFALNLGLLQPRFFLRLFFGNPGGAMGRRLEDTGDDYLAMLARGSKAGLYAPLAPRKTWRGPEHAQASTVENFKTVMDYQMKIVKGKWPDPELDRYRLPHPIMGKLPVREMLQFGLLHAYHHTNIVRVRLSV